MRAASRNWPVAMRFGEFNGERAISRGKASAKFNFPLY
jgi:hypothetical protein